jgi:acetyl esterase
MKQYFHLILIALLSLSLSASLFAQTSPAAAHHSFKVAQNVDWATIDGIKLTMDIYTPDTGKDSYPVLVIYHGGGWLINNESIMDEMAAYVASNAEYVVCNVNYRLLPANNNSTTMDEIIQDALGAVLWIKENIKQYKGDPDRIAVSGDSAGGHLASMVVNAGDRLESDGMAGAGLGFKPSYLPKGQSAEDIVRQGGINVQAAVLNYPAVDIYAACIGDGKGNGFESPSNGFWSFAQSTPRGIFGPDVSISSHPAHYKFCSPIYTIPPATKRKLPPHFITVGELDNLTTPQSIGEYAKQLRAAGHQAEVWIYKGKPHAYLDSGSNQFLGTSFSKDAIPAIEKIVAFLNSVFY